MILVITNQCNRNCHYCFEGEFRNHGRQQMSIADVERILGWAGSQNSGPNIVSIMGGEPTLHPDMLAIIDFLQAREQSVRILTNLCCDRSLVQELLARILALLRRAQGTGEKSEGGIYSFGEFSLDTQRQELSRGSESIPLNTQEYRLLKFFAQNPQRVLGRYELMDEVWGYDSVTSTRTVDVHVAWLRSKLGEKSRPRHLITVRGRGYRFEP